MREKDKREYIKRYLDLTRERSKLEKTFDQSVSKLDVDSQHALNSLALSVLKRFECQRLITKFLLEELKNTNRELSKKIQPILDILEGNPIDIV